MTRTPSALKTNEDRGSEPSGPRSLTRVLGLFELLTQRPSGMSLAELNLALDSPKSSLLNLLRPLVNEGFLVHAGNSYRLGPAIFRLAAGVMAAWDFPPLIRPFMEELAQRTNETVMLGVLVPEAEAITYVEIIPSPHPIRYQIPVGTSRPLYASTAGRLLLAHSDAAWQRNYLASVNLKAPMEQAMTRVGLRRELEQIRSDGLSCSFDRYTRGLASVAAPVLDASCLCVASLNVAGPTERFRNELDFLKATVKEVATRASGLISDIRQP